MMNKKEFKELRKTEFAALEKLEFPFKAIFMDEEVEVLGSVDDFEPYKFFVKGKRTLTQLMCKMCNKKNVRAIMMASHLKVDSKYLVTPTPKYLMTESFFDKKLKEVRKSKEVKQVEKELTRMVLTKNEVVTLKKITDDAEKLKSVHKAIIGNGEWRPITSREILDYVGTKEDMMEQEKEEVKKEFARVGLAWWKRKENEKSFASAIMKIDGQDFHFNLFPNAYKTEEKHPDFVASAKISDLKQLSITISEMKEEEEKESEFSSFGAAWEKDIKNSDKKRLSLSFNLKGDKVFINLFPNSHKQEEKHPDFIMSMDKDLAKQFNIVVTEDNSKKKTKEQSQGLER